MEVVGKYRLVRKLAEGGMAEVFLAQVDGPGGFSKPVVVKRVLPELSRDQSFINMFMSEAKLVAQLNHPNIVQVNDFGLHDGSYFLVMEYVDGFNLRGLYKRAEAAKEPIPFELAARMTAGACEGLAYAHAFAERGKPLNIIHRDISPENLLVGSNGVVKVADFGIARVAGQQRMTRTGTVRGKLVYMAPEQMQGEAVDCRVDVFAMGIVLYELICGRRPFEAKSELDAIKAILGGNMIPAASWRPDMPPELQQIIDRAMARSSADRFPDCTTLQLALERFIALRGVIANTQAIGKLVERFAEPPPAERPPATTLILPPRQQRPLPSRPGLAPAPPAVAAGPGASQRGRGIGLAMAVLIAIGALIAWWPEPEPPLVLVPPPPLQPVAVARAAAIPPVRPFGEEDYPVPPPPPAPPGLGAKVARLFKRKPAAAPVAPGADAGAELKRGEVTKLSSAEEEAEAAKPAEAAPAQAAERPALKGRIMGLNRYVELRNDNPFGWSACEVRMPSQKVLKIAEPIGAKGSRELKREAFEDDLREPDAHMKAGWALIRCKETAGYLWWGEGRGL